VVELSEEQKDKKEEWKSIKVKEGTYDELQKMGKGIGGAIEMLVNAKKQAVSDKMDNISDISSELADIMFTSGIFDIKFGGSGIDKVELTDNGVTLHGYICIGIDDKDAREEVYKVLSDGLERED
jgi:hypothetical protein